MLGLLHVNFSQIYKTVMALGHCQFRFCSISWEQIDGIRPSFVCSLILTKSRFVGVCCLRYLSVCPSVMSCCLSVGWGVSNKHCLLTILVVSIFIYLSVSFYIYLFVCFFVSLFIYLFIYLLIVLLFLAHLSRRLRMSYCDHLGPYIERMLTIWSNVSAPLNKMVAMPNTVKHFFSELKKL